MRANTQPLTTHPVEHPADDLGLILQHLIAGGTAALGPRDIAVAIGGAAEDIDHPLASLMAFAPAVPLQNLRPLVFSNHTLHLEQQFIFR